MFIIQYTDSTPCSFAIQPVEAEITPTSCFGYLDNYESALREWRFYWNAACHVWNQMGEIEDFLICRDQLDECDRLLDLVKVSRRLLVDRLAGDIKRMQEWRAAHPG